MGLKPWYHIDGISNTRHIKYDITDGQAQPATDVTHTCNLQRMLSKIDASQTVNFFSCFI